MLWGWGCVCRARRVLTVAASVLSTGRGPRVAAALSAGLLLPEATVTVGGNYRCQQGVIWLILPVVICLSQRLSHACLSISTLYGETANGSLNQL